MGEETRVSVLANAQDVHLLREIAKWRRASGITYWRARGNLGRFVQWTGAGMNGPQVSIDFLWGDDGWYAEMSIGRRREFANLKIHDCWSLVQAVDVLVAVGYLPPRFSSAYRAGWEALGRSFQRPIGKDGVRDVADPAPAVESAW